MDKAEIKARTQARDDLIMYKFRTKLCSRKPRCRNPSNCFDAHANSMKRRVPRQVGGLFNYIPEPCQEFLKWKECRFGDDCPQSHGWLETIFHPLIYKTKLCKSQRHNGVCSEYGVYCAKAHARCEVRSLVCIYGEQWKRNYDISQRMSASRMRNDRFTSPNVNTIKKRESKIERVGLAMAPKTRHILDVNLFAQYILDGQISKRDHPPMCLEQPSPKAEFLTDSDDQFEDLESCDAGEKSQHGKTGSSSGSIEITSYTELYSLDGGLNDERLRNGSLTDLVIMKQQESGSYDTISPTKDCVMASYSPSFVQDDLENISLSPRDYGDSFFCYDDKGVGSSVVSQNWFLPSCLETASKVFEN